MPDIPEDACRLQSNHMQEIFILLEADIWWRDIMLSLSVSKLCLKLIRYNLLDKIIWKLYSWMYKTTYYFFVPIFDLNMLMRSNEICWQNIKLFFAMSNRCYSCKFHIWICHFAPELMSINQVEHLRPQYVSLTSLSIGSWYHFFRVAQAGPKTYSGIVYSFQNFKVSIGDKQMRNMRMMERLITNFPLSPPAPSWGRKRKGEGDAGSEEGRKEK